MIRDSKTTERTPDRLLTRAMLRELVPVSDMAIWRWLKRGTFPHPIKHNGRNYWQESEVAAWLELRSAERARPETGGAR